MFDPSLTVERFRRILRVASILLALESNSSAVGSTKAGITISTKFTINSLFLCNLDIEYLVRLSLEIRALN